MITALPSGQCSALYRRSSKRRGFAQLQGGRTTNCVGFPPSSRSSLFPCQRRRRSPALKKDSLGAVRTYRPHYRRRPIPPTDRVGRYLSITALLSESFLSASRAQPKENGGVQEGVENHRGSVGCLPSLVLCVRRCAALESVASHDKQKICNFFQKGVYKSESIVYNNDISKGCERKDALSFTYREPRREVFVWWERGVNDRQ